MTCRRPLSPAVLAATAVLVPAAAAQTPAPTLGFDRACYTEHQPMRFTGTGFTPGGPVDLVFSRPGFVLGSYEAGADAAGNVVDFAMAEAGQLLGDDEDRETRFVTANDRTRIEQGAEPQTQFAGASFTFTRWMGFSPGRYVPGRKARAEVFGWAFAEGKTAYFLFRKGSRTAASVRLGTIAGPCGDLQARFTVPRKLRRGAYKVFLSTSAARPSSRGTWRGARVTRAASATAARRQPMRRAG